MANLSALISFIRLFRPSSRYRKEYLKKYHSLVGPWRRIWDVIFRNLSVPRLIKSTTEPSQTRHWGLCIIPNAIIDYVLLLLEASKPRLRKYQSFPITKHELWRLRCSEITHQWPFADVHLDHSNTCRLFSHPLSGHLFSQAHDTLLWHTSSTGHAYCIACLMFPKVSNIPTARWMH